MKEHSNYLSDNKGKGLFIKSLQLEGDEQMAIDLMLLEKIISDSNFSMAMRFYTWFGNWLSIGKNQKDIPKRWLELHHLRKLKIVRRPSGGNAVLHSGGLTYSLVWDSPPKKKKESYLLASKWLVDGFKQLGINLNSGTESSLYNDKNCFATSTAADLIDEKGQKRVGSAQYWKNGHLLQHGEILISPPKDLWLEVFNTCPPKPLGLSISQGQIINLLKKSLISNWSNINWQNHSLSKEEITEVKNNYENHLPKELFS